MTPEPLTGVCPHCMREVRLTPVMHSVATHRSYAWMPQLGPEVLPNKNGICPGTHHKPLQGDPEIDTGPPAHCPL